MEDKHSRQREQQIFQEHTWLLQGGQYAHRGVSEVDRVAGNKVRESISAYSLLIQLSTTPSPMLLASHLSAPVLVQAPTILALFACQQPAQHFMHCRCSICIWWWHVWVTFSRTCYLGWSLIKYLLWCWERLWRQEEKGITEDKMVGWHHWLDGHESEQAPGVGDGQGSLGPMGLQRVGHD